MAEGESSQPSSNAENRGVTVSLAAGVSSLSEKGCTTGPVGPAMAPITEGTTITPPWVGSNPVPTPAPVSVPSGPPAPPPKDD